VRAHTEQLNLSYKGRNKRQGKNDNELFAIQAFKMPPKESAPEVSSGVPTLYDEGKGDRQGVYSKHLNRAQKGFTFTRNNEEKNLHLRNLYESLGVKTNPPTGIEEWDLKVAEYRAERANYMDVQGDMQPWAEHALFKYPEWEFVLLEKGRLLMEAIELNTLTDEEHARVRQEYSSMTLDLDNPLGNLLASLEEEEEDFDEGDEEGDEETE